jgi:hypothetical protein
MTDYQLAHFGYTAAEALTGKTADITEWDDDEGARLITYPAARVTGVQHDRGWLVIEPARLAVVTDRNTGTCLARRPVSGRCTCPWPGSSGSRT